MNMELKLTFPEQTKEWALEPEITHCGQEVWAEWYARLADARKNCLPTPDFEITVTTVIEEASWLRPENQPRIAPFISSYQEQARWRSEALTIFFNNFLDQDKMKRLYSEPGAISFGAEVILHSSSKLLGRSPDFETGRWNPYCCAKLALTDDDISTIEPNYKTTSDESQALMLRRPLDELPDPVMARIVYPEILRTVFTFPGYRKGKDPDVESLLADRSALKDLLNLRQWIFGLA